MLFGEQKNGIRFKSFACFDSAIDLRSIALKWRKLAPLIARLNCFRPSISHMFISQCTLLEFSDLFGPKIFSYLTDLVYSKYFKLSKHFTQNLSHPLQGLHNQNPIYRDIVFGTTQITGVVIVFRFNQSAIIKPFDCPDVVTGTP